MNYLLLVGIAIQGAVCDLHVEPQLGALVEEYRSAMAEGLLLSEGSPAPEVERVLSRLGEARSAIGGLQVPSESELVRWIACGETGKAVALPILVSHSYGGERVANAVMLSYSRGDSIGVRQDYFRYVFHVLSPGQRSMQVAAIEHALCGEPETFLLTSAILAVDELPADSRARVFACYMQRPPPLAEMVARLLPEGDPGVREAVRSILRRSGATSALRLLDSFPVQRTGK